jgi:NAD(P)-dependent dehydrogenase (short-subunit alcohol dehydrogenase family)
MSKDLEGQVAVVTGASRGIGRAIARRLAAEGARVAVVARSASQLETLAREISADGGTALPAPVDVTDRDQVERLTRRVEAELGPVDLLVNNAGRLAAIGPVWEVDPDSWWEEVRVNLLGLYLCCRAVLPGMVTRGQGRIVNMAGAGTTRPFPFGSAYGAGKVAVTRLTETLAVELSSYGAAVKVFALSPGLVRTEMTEAFLQSEQVRAWMAPLSDRLEAGDTLPPEHAARMVAALAAGRLDGLHGRFLNTVTDLDRLEQLARRADEARERNLRTLQMTELD